MPLLSLPLTFNNSFWSQDYRKGLEIAHTKLSQGVEENGEIIAFIRARANVERSLANSLLSTQITSPSGSGFGSDDGATLLIAFRGLQAESRKQGGMHRVIAQELDNLVADPFEEWANQHAARVAESKDTLIDGWLRIYEDGVHEVEKIKQAYIFKRQQADDAEDDAKFAPANEAHGNLASPPSKALQRSGTVSERIAQGLFGRKSQPLAPVSQLSNVAEEAISVAKLEKDSDQQSVSDAETVRPTSPLKKLDKGKGRAIDASPPGPLRIPQSQASLDNGPLVTLVGVPFTGSAILDLLKRAKSQLPLRPIRIPILGEYEDTFTGADFTKWLKDNVPAFEGSTERAEAAARDLTERDNLLKRVGDLGNKFENHPAVIYQFRPKAFEPLPSLSLPDQNKDEYTLSPVPPSSSAGSLLQRSNTLSSFISKRLNNSAEPLHVKLRAEADAADARYRYAVHALDRQRLSLEDRIEGTLKLWNRWELDRLRAVKTVLLQYHGTLSNVPRALGPSLDTSSNLISSFQPEADLTATIERCRSGPFRPSPPIYKAVGSDVVDKVFGMELRRWAGETALDSGRTQTEGSPPIVTSFLRALTTAYEKLPNNDERRKAWIYDVPLPSQHKLREAVNALPVDQSISQHLLAQYDAPVLASTLKLWLLELEVPICLWDGWDEIRNMYPSVGADSSFDHSIIDDVRIALGRLPNVHLLVLDEIIKHLNKLTKDTEEGTEPADIYRNKLALSLGRAILRPRIETPLSVQDKHPTVFFIDLLTHYENVLPKAIQQKRRDSGSRLIPLRKRTAPIDMRVHRGTAPTQFDLSKLMPQPDPSRLRTRSPGPEGRVPRPLSLTASLPQPARTFSPPISSPPRTTSPHRNDPNVSSTSQTLPHDQAPAPLPESAPVGLPTPGPTPQPTPPVDGSLASQLTPVPVPPVAALPAPTSAPQSVAQPAPISQETIPLLPEAERIISSSPAPAHSPVAPPSTAARAASPSTPDRRGSVTSLGTSSSRSASPVKTSPSAPNGRVAAARATLQRNASVNEGGPGGPRGPRGPRVTRGPRVVGAPTNANKGGAGAGGESTGSNTSRTSMSPSRSSSPSIEKQIPSTTAAKTPVVKSRPGTSTPLRTSSVAKKQRPSSAVAKKLTTRSMASGSEDETLGRNDD
ncbi:uncharacterized protein EI90DRAFT_2998640 [Cantharellus anzutake]|uniref:uncharacterized protein n=1 Tax=Cantharellus anzutake TaxID=1750568 RepID=UPI0019065E35|nr:uncharacterized protein EI90DRAFT_2998640 [Cantharellus anzutake]KAF8327151.1 hypothetical protein EI90DRAFT_2998640 [Cantharellus anzutake]